MDICRAIIAVLEAPCDSVHNQILTVGDNVTQLPVREIAEFVAETFPGCQVTFGFCQRGQSSYRVSFDKIRK